MRQSEWVEFVILAGCLFLSSNSLAQHMNAANAPCRDAGSNAEVTQCFIAASQVADKQMNETYARVRQVLSEDERRQLQEAQRLWLKFRDANCTAERSLYDGGTAAPMVYASCMEADTRQRTSELNTMYGWRVEKFGKKTD